MVLFAHAQQSCNFPFNTPMWLGWFLHGQLGVRIFFVISGFIITLLILKEEENNNSSFSIGNFYLRRILRILPVYYSFLLCVMIVSRFASLRLNPGEMTAALTFTTGWWSNGTWILGHTWSLSVEEQFYLLWPGVLYGERIRGYFKKYVGFLRLISIFLLGMISYSWYKWQELFLFECGRYFDDKWFRFPVNIGLSFVAACVSYYLIEKVFERLKKKLVAR